MSKEVIPPQNIKHDGYKWGWHGLVVKALNWNWMVQGWSLSTGQVLVSLTQIMLGGYNTIN